MNKLEDAINMAVQQVYVAWCNDELNDEDKTFVKERFVDTGVFRALLLKESDDGGDDLDAIKLGKTKVVISQSDL